MSDPTQDAVDYVNEAQMRVCGDTRILIKRGAVLVTAGTATYPLASDVIELRSVQDSTGAEVPFLRILDVLSLQSGSGDPAQDGGYYTISGLIGFWPTPTTDASYGIFYEARPAPFTSDATFEVTGDAQRLVDRLVAQMKLADDGQPELAAAERNFYQVEMSRVRSRPRRQQPDRIRTALDL